MTELSHPTDPFEQAPTLFCGREQEIAWVAEQLKRGERVVAVYGIRRIGKTAFLHALAGQLSDRYLALYVDAGLTDGAAVAQVATGVANAVRAAGMSPAPVDEMAFAAEPHRAWSAYVEALDANLSQSEIVLLIDNVDRVSAAVRQVLLQTPVPAVITAESARRLADGAAGPIPAGPAVTLGALESEAAADLVKALVTPKSPIDPWAVRRILEITSDQPHYIHLFCRVLVACCVYRVPVTPPHVEAALASILETPVSEFIIEWEALRSREQVLLSVFGSLRGLGGVATQYDIQKAFTRYGPTPPLREIVDTLDGLVAQGTLEKMGTNSYRFRLELYRLWIDHLYPADDLVRKQGWQFSRPFLGDVPGKIGRRLAQRRTLWLSVGTVALVLLIVAVQPALWRGCSRPVAVSTRTPAPSVAPQTPTPTVAPDRTRAVAQSELPLPGYDLLVMSRDGPQSAWQIYALDTRADRRVRLTETEANDRTPKWSPDGRYVAFASDRDGDRDIYVMDLAQALEEGASYAPVNLSRNEEPDWQPAWSPDGTQIAFSCYRDDNWEICVVAADGDHLERLTAHPESDISPTWSPDGRQLLFVSRRMGDADLYTYHLATGALTQLTTSEYDEYDPAWSPDGEWIAFVRQIGTQSDLYVMPSDSFDAVNLTNSAYANDFQPVWTADSEHVIFVTYTAAEGDHDLHIVRRDGSERRVLVDTDMDDLAPNRRDIVP